MNEEILRVLKMVEEGKIDSRKAAELIEVLKIPKNESTLLNKQEKMLKINVLSSEGDKVYVNLPVNFIKGVIKACGKIPVDVNGIDQIDAQMLLQAIDSGLEGKIVDVKSTKGDNVEIYIE
jgi:hypothetical protein